MMVRLSSSSEGININNIKASASVEQALYNDHRVSEVAAVGVPDARLGELVTAFVSTKAAYHGLVSEEGLKALARDK